MRSFGGCSRGLALPQDWTVLLGTLYLCDSNAQLVKDVFRRFPNYDEQKTCSNIESWELDISRLLSVIFIASME